MNAQPSEAVTPRRIEFSTTDSGLAVEYLQQAYRTGLWISGARDGHVFGHSRLDGGSFAVDDVRLPMELYARQEPFHSLVVVTLCVGRVERECNAVTERFRAGDVFIDADPTLPSSLRVTGPGQLQTTMLDMAVVAQLVTTAAPGLAGRRARGPVRWTGYQPVSAAAAAHWRRTVDYLGELVGNPDAAAQPLIRGNAARLLAATALATFPNTALTQPNAQDRRDATSATVRRAVGFIEQHAHLDIGLVDIAAAANVSIRTVQLAFRRHHDTTPMCYLRAVRLDRVHHELHTADPSRGATVTAIAQRWGFYNHSRFATRYRRTYGVTPRDTLHNR
jgi:AraC-like DNA-binding protein